MAANDDWADMSLASSVAACRSMDSSSLYVVRSDSESAYDNRQPDSGAREVVTNTREVATKSEHEQSVIPYVQVGKGKRLFKRIGLGSLIERNHFDKKRQPFPVHESFNGDGQYENESPTLTVSQIVDPSNNETDDSNSLEGYGSDNSDTASLMAVASDTWEGANHLSHRYAAVTSNSNGTQMKNTGHDGSVVHSVENDTATLEKVGTKTAPALHAGTYKSTSILTGTTEETTPSKVERRDRSVSRVPNSKSTVKTPTEVEQLEHHWIDDHETAENGITMLPNKNADEDDAQEKSRAQARKAAKRKGFFGGLRRTREKFMSNELNTSAEVEKPKDQVVRSLLDDDGKAEDEISILSNKNDDDDDEDVQENSRAQARKTTKGKGVFGLRRALFKRQKTVDADEAPKNNSLVGLENGDEQKSKNTTNRIFRRQSSGSFFENDSSPTVIVRNTKDKEIEGAEACPRKMASPRGRSAHPVWDTLTRRRSRSGSLGKRAMKNVAFTKSFKKKMCAEGSVDSPITLDTSDRPKKVFRLKRRKSCLDICWRCVNEIILDQLILWEDDFSVVTPDLSIGASTWSDTNSGTGATLSSWRSEGGGTLKSEDVHIHAVAEDYELEAKVRKERFLLFCKALCRDLKNTDPAMHARVKAVIQDCTNKKKRRVPGFDFESSMRTRLLETVGESIWRRVERDLDKKMNA